MKESQTIEWKESRGRGIELIQNACREHGSPEPLFRCDSGLWVEFPFAIQAPKSSVNKLIETAQETILSLLKKQPTLTRRELASKLELSNDGVKYHLNKLKKASFMRHVGSTKNGHWEVLKG